MFTISLSGVDAITACLLTNYLCSSSTTHVTNVYMLNCNTQTHIEANIVIDSNLEDVSSRSCTIDYELVLHTVICFQLNF